MKDKRILVTGISGFIGSHLAITVNEMFPGARVFGVSRSKSPGTSRIRAVDLLDSDEISAVIEELRPDYIFHMAGVTHTHDLDRLYRGNVEIMVNLLEAVKTTAHQCRVVIPGSAAEYGQVPPGKLPITEDQPPRPISLYGVAKAWQTTVAVYYASRGVDIVIGRVFNVIGRGMSENLSVGAFASQLKKFQKSEEKFSIKVGNLKPKRDFLDIDDVSRALIALALKGTSGQIYNVCSGGSISMSEVLKKLIDQIDVEVEVVVDAERIKAADISDSFGSYQKLKSATGWRPAVSLDESLAKLMS
ncbi:MAG: GDP-mannose 4,6-dehydratase [Actinomycetota bacterium]|nr:GDP-mannose 4,6-dehydratase [Actinomycetota bacterium]